MNMSKSFVARGSAWTPTAYPPTTRYLTPFALNASKSSFRSLFIVESNSLECVRIDTGLPYGGEAVSDRDALPVSIALGLLLSGVCDLANCLIHLPPLHQHLLADKLRQVGLFEPMLALVELIYLARPIHGAKLRPA